MMCALIGLVTVGITAAAGLPGTLEGGWTSSPERVVAPSGIFDYMDGAGELYLAYGVKQVRVRTYSCSGQPTITCEVYEMPTAADAFGVWSQDRTGEKLQIGQGAVYSRGLLISWRGRLFVRLLAERETAEARRAMVGLARSALGSERDAALPQTIKLLPKAWLVDDSIHFFRTATCLRYFYFLSEENLLGLSPETEAVLGTYSTNGRKSQALVVRYPNAQAAAKADRQYRAIYLKGLDLDGKYALTAMENGRWTASLAMRDILAVVLESPSRADSERTIKALEVQIRSSATGKGDTAR